ncbi:hypothetical protein DX912_06955 [Lysobacter soli]|uniref:Uncharacterized protein n=1 Tax=Lysobacter soli TaxID=453783 RepID=A0A3D8VFZ0_9GAMM|nr:hypothetical protein [Lysobacter soli]RDY68332.1 hypothetical protein DX912_06955 [Lysobacter soli]
MDGAGQAASQDAGSSGNVAPIEVPRDLWQQYTYLGDKCDSYSRSSFEDFGLLFSTGAMAAWVPVSAQFPEAALGRWAPLTGFVAILFFIAIVGTRTLAKQALVQYYLANLARVEASVASRLPPNDADAFAFARRWPQWQATHYEPLMQRFLLLFAIFLAFVPTGALAVGSGALQAAVYFGCFLVVGGIYGSAAGRLRGAAMADA